MSRIKEIMKMREKSPFLKKQYQENEVKANRIVTILLFIYATFPISNQLTLLVDYVEGLDAVNKCVFLPMGITFLIIALIAWAKKFRGAWIRPVLMTALFVAVGICFLVFTTYVSFMVLLPVFVSMVYLDLRYTQKVLLISTGIFLLDCVLNIYLERTSPAFQVFHINTTFNLWTTWLDAILYVILPVILTMVFVGLFIVSSMRNFRDIMYNQAANSEKIARLNSELSMASEIQNNTLPKEEYLSPDGGFAISCTEVPLKEVGGDFYDYFTVGDNILVFMIADVSDKGLPAAMFMMAAKKAIHCAVRCEHSLEKAVRLANKLICEDANGMFLTLWLAIIDTSSGVGKFVNAGHVPPYIKKLNGEVEKLENEPDLFMGPFPEYSPSEHTFRLEEGDVLFLYTDGLTDALNAENKAFGEERLLKAIEESGNSAHEIRTGVLKEIERFTEDAKPFDDMTVLALECRKLNAVSKLELSFVSGPEGTEMAINRINELMERCNCPDDARRNVDVILDEVLVNIHDYAYEGEGKEVQMRVFAGSSFISMRFFDTGAPFDPTKTEAPDLEGEPKIGGMGIWLYSNLADKVRYRYKDGKNELAIRLIWNL